MHLNEASVMPPSDPGFSNRQLLSVAGSYTTAVCDCSMVSVHDPPSFNVVPGLPSIRLFFGKELVNLPFISKTVVSFHNAAVYKASYSSSVNYEISPKYPSAS